MEAVSAFTAQYSRAGSMRDVATTPTVSPGSSGFHSVSRSLVVTAHTVRRILVGLPFS